MISGEACKQRMGSMFQAWELLHEVPRYHHSLRGKRWCVQDSLEPGGFSRAPRWVSPLVDPEPLDEADDEPTGSSAAMPSMSARAICVTFSI